METDFHSPAVIVNDLRAILAIDKLPIGFFLGAGCPFSIKGVKNDKPLIPDARGLTKAVLEQSSSPNLAELVERLQAMLVEDGQENPTIEHMLTRIRTMETIVGNKNVRGFSRPDLQQLEQSICKTISSVADQKLPASTPYHSLARWVGQRTSRSIIFTTNYDLLIEQALEALQVPFFDGFIGSYRPFFDQRAIERDDFPDRWALVCKFHGSINWRLVGERNQIVRSLDKAGDEVLIHPSHLKYTQSRRMPYLVMLDRLKAFIGNDRKPAALFTVGYSFSDEHINDTIADSLRGNPSAVCYALQYENLPTYPQVIDLAQQCANLHVLAPDEVITNGRCCRWKTCPHDQVEELGGVFRPQCNNNGSSATESEGQDDEVTVESCLGDFDAFGRFLASLLPRESTARRPS